MSSAPVILWFRRDLRLHDNPALQAAYTSGQKILPIYIHNETDNKWSTGAAARCWLHRSLQSLNSSLGNRLILRKGRLQDVMDCLLRESGADRVYFNRLYDPFQIEEEDSLKDLIRNRSVQLHPYDSCLLFKPERLLKKDGSSYQVFTPFYRNACLRRHGDPSPPLPAPPPIPPDKHWPAQSSALEELKLLPDHDWPQKFWKLWTPGEKGARQRLKDFLNEKLAEYSIHRDRPDLDTSSRLSPHLHFGEISAREVWHSVRLAQHSAGGSASGHSIRQGAQTFLRELGWREFTHNILYHFPDLPERPYNKKFLNFPWRQDRAALQAWRKGKTGYPIVDAGMRQLYDVGWMHNRVRMIVGSFLVKDLHIHWIEGEKWFWEYLLDADLANNSAGWQWVAGSGVDAAPYFRIFNPVLQSKKFDPNGSYIRSYVPELKNLPSPYIHAPWTAPEGALKKASIQLGLTYPRPIVDHKQRRHAALEAYKNL